MATKTPLYQEALVEVKKLKELAKQEAEKTILEKFSPMVDQMIDRELSGLPVLLEQDEDNAVPPMAPPIDTTLGASAANPTMPATAPMDATPVPPSGAMGTATLSPSPENTPSDPLAPEMPLPADPSVPPVSNGGSMQIPVPGPDGKITVDIESLFAATPAGSEPNFAMAAVTPAIQASDNSIAQTPAAPAPTESPLAASVAPELGSNEQAPVPQTTGTGEVVSPENTNEVPPEQLAEMFNSLILKLQEDFNTIKNTNISTKQKSLMENKLLALYEMAQKAKASGDIPVGILAHGEVHLEIMFANLRESAKQDNSYKRQSIKEDTKMAKKEFKGLKEFAKSLFEEVDVKGKSGFGDGDAVSTDWNATTAKDETPKKKSGNNGGVEDPGKAASLKGNVAESVDGEDEAMDETAALESELMEMLSSMEEEETPSVMEAKKKAIKGKLKSLKEEEAKLVKALKECGMGMEHGMGAPAMDAVKEPANINIKISLEDGEVKSVDTDGMDMDSDASDKDMSDVDADSDDDDTIEIVADSDEDSEDSDEDSSDEEDAVDADASDEDAVSDEKSKSMVSENKRLRKELSETQLLTARSLFVNKLFAEQNLSKTTKQKIVEYIDNAQSVEEVKAKFVQVKKMLAEANRPGSLNRAGSSSKPATSTAGSLNEGASSVMKLEVQPNRWMQLAGITKKSD
jgi:hypothetical protein